MCERLGSEHTIFRGSRIVVCRRLSFLLRWDLKGPLENIVVSGVYAVAPTRCSLFSPLSPSLHLAPRALALQAHSLRPTLSAEGVNVQIPSRSAKRKATLMGCFLFGCGGGIWTSRPPGYEPDELPSCSTPRYWFFRPSTVGAGDRGRTGTILSYHGILSPGRLPVPPHRHSACGKLQVALATCLSILPRFFDFVNPFLKIYPFFFALYTWFALGFSKIYILYIIHPFAQVTLPEYVLCTAYIIFTSPCDYSLFLIFRFCNMGREVFWIKCTN